VTASTRDGSAQEFDSRARTDQFLDGNRRLDPLASEDESRERTLRFELTQITPRFRSHSMSFSASAGSAAAATEHLDLAMLAVPCEESGLVPPQLPSIPESEVLVVIENRRARPGLHPRIGRGRVQRNLRLAFFEAKAGDDYVSTPFAASSAIRSSP
jgi:hypothetical protein